MAPQRARPRAHKHRNCYLPKPLLPIAPLHGIERSISWGEDPIVQIRHYDALHTMRIIKMLLMPNLALTSIAPRNCRERAEAATRDNTSFRWSPEARKGMAQSLDCGGPDAAKFGLLLLIDSRGTASGPAPYCELSRKGCRDIRAPGSRGSWPSRG
jgi:hypothetical protein